MKTLAHIHSLKGRCVTVDIIQENGFNNVIAFYNGKYYTAVYNPFVGAYYVDDVYGEIEFKSNPFEGGEKK